MPNTPNHTVRASHFPPLPFGRTRSYKIDILVAPGGMIWPRGIVGAAALWNWNSSVDSQSPEFIDAIWSTNDRLAKSGALVCPSRCSCDQVSACGKPYRA